MMIYMKLLFVSNSGDSDSGDSDSGDSEKKSNLWILNDHEHGEPSDRNVPCVRQ